MFRRHWHQHNRFYAGAAAALLAYIAAAWTQQPVEVRALAASNGFFATYLLLLGLFASRSTPDSTMKHARVEDEGLPLIVSLTVVAVGSSLTAIVTLLTSPSHLEGVPLAIAITAVPLGWATVHASVALHYARLYYAEEEDGGSAEGLEFPCDAEPDVWDFMYFSFVLGMTAQTSDVTISGRRMRRSVLVHSVVSYFYNTVIIALSVNAAVQIAG